MAYLELEANVAGDTHVREQTLSPQAGPVDVSESEKLQQQRRDSPQQQQQRQQPRKAPNTSPFLTGPGSRPSLDTLSGLSTHSLDGVDVRPSARAHHRPSVNRSRLRSRSPGPVLEDASTRGARVRNKMRRIWYEQKGSFLMILAQFFAACMSTTARFMEVSADDSEPMSTFQILFVRMAVTMTASLAYMYIRSVPDAPFGAKEVRWSLIGRGFCGFFGVFGLYFSLIYLPLAEATVITFIAPLLAAWITSFLLKTPFTRVHKIAGFISMAGVVLIAQPIHFVSDSGDPTPHASSGHGNGTVPTPQLLSRALSTSFLAIRSEPTDAVTPSQRAIAVAVALLGVCGAAGAYTFIMQIGRRAHPLISVNYFATWCTIISLGALLLTNASFRLPTGWREWLLMAFLGVSGFVMQFLLTAALSIDRGGSMRLNMVYTQMLFAVAFDKVVWGVSPSWVGLLGSLMILGSAVWVALARAKVKPKEAEPERQTSEEERGLVEGVEMGIVEGEDGNDSGNDSGDDSGSGNGNDNGGDDDGGTESAAVHVIDEDDGDDDDDENTELTKTSSA